MIWPFFVPSPRPRGGFVLDASVAARWCFSSRGTVYTSAVLDRILAVKSSVPLSWTLHLTELLRAGQNQGLKTAAAVDRFLSGLGVFPIFLELDTPARAWPEILDLARAHSLSIFDAAYLELALHLKLPLATIDPNLTRAAANVGVPIFTP